MTLREAAELAWRQIFPNPGDETAITKEEFIQTALLQYSWEVWRNAKEDKRSEGFYNVPSNLMSSTTLDIKENKVDLSGLNILRALPNDTWLINVGGFLSKCKYIASTINTTQLLEDDDSLPDDARTYLVVGNEIIFPKGAHSNQIPLIYANNGLGIDSDEVEIDEMLGAIIRTKLIDIYGRKGAEDETNNSNSSE